MFAESPVTRSFGSLLSHVIRSLLPAAVRVIVIGIVSASNDGVLVTPAISSAEVTEPFPADADGKKLGGIPHSFHGRGPPPGTGTGPDSRG